MSGPRRGPEMNQLQMIEDGAVLIEGDRIREVGPTRRLENLTAVRNAKEISAAGRVVMPAFVDSHTHVLAGPARIGSQAAGAQPDARMGLVNLNAVRDSSGRRLTVEAHGVLKQCLAHGTTTIESKSGAALNLPGETKLLRVITSLGDTPLDVVPTFFGALTTPPEFDGDAARYIHWLVDELMPVVHKRGLARFVDGCADRGAFTASELRPYFRRARELGFELKLSALQFGSTDGLELTDEFEFASIDGLECADEKAADRIAASGAIATLTPASSFFLDLRRAPARDLIARGVPVAIASNFSRIATPTYNMQIVIFLACHDLGMTPAEAVTAATINGAHALKMGHRLGSLESGKQADLLILNVGDYRELAHEFGINLVGSTLKRGVVVYDKSGVRWPAE